MLPVVGIHLNPNGFVLHAPTPLNPSGAFGSESALLKGFPATDIVRPLNSSHVRLFNPDATLAKYNCSGEKEERSPLWLFQLILTLVIVAYESVSQQVRLEFVGRTKIINLSGTTDS